MTKVGCILQASHRLPASPHANEPLDSPEAFQRLKESSDRIDKTRIVTLHISEPQALEIVSRLWPGESLLGATCGRGFSIDTAEQAAIVNQILAPEASIFFGPDHEWTLQTWPEAQPANCNKPRDDETIA